jgi:hypothetical protein
MYCYGFDNDIVGISGIVGCIGVVYIGRGFMYAVHIPDGGPDENKMAGKTFARWVKNQELSVGKRDSNLFAFVNGTNRQIASKNFSKAEDEARDIKKALGSPPTTVFRLMKHLGSQSGTASANSAAIMVERVQPTESNSGGCAMWYKQDFGHIQWVDGGKKESGMYKNKPSFSGTKKPSDLNAHWWRIDTTNCTMTNI